MKYIEKFPNMVPIFEERENVIRTNRAFPCCVCGCLCDYVEINYEAYFCSEECVQKEGQRVEEVSKAIMKGYDYKKDLYPASDSAYGCAHCGHPINRGELMLDCPDCAAVFCEECVTSGVFENHNCEDYNWEDDDDDF